MSLIINIIGGIGLIMLLSAFGLVQFRKLTDDSPIYNILNITGALLVMIYVLSFKAWLSVLLNIIWAVIGLWDLFKNYKKRKITSNS